MFRTTLLVLLFSCAARAGDDEARLKPKAYSPGKTQQNRPYQAAAYAPAQASRTIGAPLSDSRGGFWRFFKPKPLEKMPLLPNSPAAGSTPYVQRQQITVPSITPDQTAVLSEHKPFSGDKKLEAAGFTAPEKPREKNPLLAPRQGIKEPQP